MNTVYARHIWWLILAMAALAVASFALTGLHIDPFSKPALLAPFGLLAAIWWFYRNVRPDPRLRTLAECFAQILLLLLFGTLLSYAAAAAPIPFRDDALLAIDTALGFDRRAYIDFFDSRPWLFNTLTLSYFTFMPQFVVVLLVLFFAKQPSRMQQFVFAAGLALLVTDAISVLTPSITTIYLDLGLPVGAEIPAYRYTPLPTLQALRSGSPYWIDLDAIEGLISFPSFHTVGAVLFIWGLWHVRYVRWFALALNLALIAATPMTGAHYFIDIAGGLFVALGTIVAAVWLGRPARGPHLAVSAHAAISAAPMEPAA